ncbi:MAG TPA: FAD-binding oxidoreductase [Porticoccaceae bacterium]|nr:FAD-binding oxidoreductase [Porticoccaceae bacterium]HIK80998.1 FAD-binding oxidoreductase [Porticoccaceae bacterium]
MDSYYTASSPARPSFKPLDGEEVADICIVGAGYTGLSSALHLAKRGYKVVLLEAETVAFGASGRNGGHVGTGMNMDQQDIERRFGREVAHSLWNMSLEAVDTVKELISDHDIDCDLKYGGVHLAHKPGYCKELEEDIAFLQKRYNFNDIEYIHRNRLKEIIGSDAYYGAQWDKASLHLHPLKYAVGLLKAAVDAGVTIYEHSRVQSYSGTPVVVKTATGQITATDLILACNGYIEGLEPKINGYIMPINNFIIATEPLSAEVSTSLIPKDTAMEDSRFVINYWKLSGDNRLIFGGGENYRRGFPSDIKGFVQPNMLKVYPQLANTQIDYGWGGTLAVTLNRLPHFGRINGNIWHLHGYSGHGVPTATFAGKLVAEAISGKHERFDIMANLPSGRFPGGTLLRWPGMVAGMLYYAMRDRI